MVEWKKIYHDPINELDFTDLAMKDMVALKPNPGSLVANHWTAHLGGTPLLCLPPMQGEKVA